MAKAFTSEAVLYWHSHIQKKILKRFLMLAEIKQCTSDSTSSLLVKMTIFTELSQTHCKY